jgi:hypothetical protein
MNALQINELLLKDGTIDIDLTTLAQGKPVTFRYANGTLLVIPSTGQQSNPVSAADFRTIYDRYRAASPRQRTQPSYYNTPNFPTAFDRNAAPYIMRLIHYFETAQ